MQKVKSNPDIFIKSLPEDIQQDIAILDKEISRVMKDKTRVLWEGIFWGGSEQKIIGYGDFQYKRSGKEIVEWFKIGLAVQKNYISVYVNAVEDKQYVAEKYGKDLGKVKVGKSSISFRALDNIDLEKLIDLIKKAETLMV